jgi:hypothetical protein
MIRTKAGKLGALAVAALVTGAAIGSCSQKGGGADQGHAKLALTAAGGITINTVGYTVLNSSAGTVLSGAFSVADPNATVSLDIALPQGNGYTISLDAASTGTPVRHFVGTSNAFNITAGGLTQVLPNPIILTDAGSSATNPGVATINATVVPGDNAPIIDSITLAPATTSANADIELWVAAHDPDGDAMTFTGTPSAAGATLTPASGTPIVPPVTATTPRSAVLRSPITGAQSITVQVSDGRGGVVTATLPFNIVGGMTTGAAGTTGAGGAAGAGAAGTGAAGTGAAGTGAGGTGAAGTGGPTQAMNLCPAHEFISGGTMCESCTANNCGLAPDPDGDSGCCALTNPADQLLCTRVIDCFQNPSLYTTGAAACTRNGDGLNCFCGTSAGMCFTTAGAANGACTQVVIDAAKTSAPTAIQAQFSDPTSPLGRANNLENCRGAFCRTQCGIN